MNTSIRSPRSLSRIHFFDIPWMKNDAIRLVLAFCAILWIIFVYGCERKVRPTVARLVETELPDQESWNSTVILSDSGRIRAQVKAGHISMYRSRQEIILDSNIVVDFFNALGEHSSVLTAKRGRVDDATKNLEAFGDVVVVSDSGTTVHTDYLAWDNRSRRIRSDALVTIQSPTEFLQGYGFEADQGIRNYKIFRVSGRTELVNTPGGDSVR